MIFALCIARLSNMLKYNEIKERVYIDLDGTPFEVISSHVFRKQQRKPVNQTKLRNLITSKVIEKTFHQNDKVEEASIETRGIKYLYENRGEYWFCEEKDPSKRFSLPTETVGPNIKFVKGNSLVESAVYNDQIIGIRVPIKVDLTVKETPPGEKGNTAQGGTKTATLETGAVINVPLFVNEGDTIRINTETGDYVERVQK